MTRDAIRLRDDLIGRLRAARSRGWSLRIRPGVVTVVVRQMHAWRDSGLGRRAAVRISKAYIDHRGARLSADEVAAMDVDALTRRVERDDD